MPPTRHDHVVFGPVRSPRLGRVLGVNLLPPGANICNLSCVYCQYGWATAAYRRSSRSARWPSAADVEAAVETRLRRAASDDEMIDRIAVTGHGEPTLHPEFEEIAGRLVAVRDRVAPGLEIAILSNSTTASWTDVRRALLLFDQRYMKLDAGDPIAYARINGTGPTLDEIVDALAALPAVVLRATFVTDGLGVVDNATDGAVADWVAAVERLEPAHVQVGTIARRMAFTRLNAISHRRLREIAEHVRAAGIPAEVFADGA